MPNEEEAVFRRADRGRVEAAGGGGAGCGADPAGGDQRTDTVSLEETVQGTGDGPDSPVQVAAGRERVAKAAGGEADAGQDDAAGCVLAILVELSLLTIGQR